MKEKKIGRPTKYKPEYVEQVYKLCLLGATDVELADFFEVDEATITRWKQSHKDFCTSIKEAKAKLDDATVVQSLFRRANGYSHPDVHISNYMGEITETPLTKHYPPDPTSMIFWLKNRQSDKWKDKQELEHSGEMRVSAIEVVRGKEKE